MTKSSALLTGAAVLALTTATGATAQSIPASPEANQTTPGSIGPAAASPGDSGTGPSNADRAQTGQLGDIIVTAQRRSENLQNVPISVQVITGQALTQQNYNNFTDLTQTTPAVHIGTVGADSQLYVRGIGSGDNPSFDQSVAIFNDDIYNGRSRLSGATFLDISRIEVLKGPQTTFFGNSAVAGALNIVTAKPGDQLEGFGRLLYGSFNQYAAEGAVTVPLTDKLSVRIAAIADGERGYIRNVNTGQSAPDRDDQAGRLTLSYKPTDDLDATFKIEGSHNRAFGTPGGLASQRVNCPAPAPLANAFVPGCVQALALGTATVPLGTDNELNTGLPGQGARLDSYTGELTLNYRHWGHTFTSVTGYTGYHFESQYSQVLPVPYQQITTPEQYHQFSQELRVASPTDQSFTYLAGLYFQSDRLASQQEDNAPFLNYVATFPGFGLLANYLPFAIVTPFVVNGKVYSAFGSISWKVVDGLKINAGLRGTIEKKEGFGSNLFGTSSQVYGGWTPIPAPAAALWALAAGQGIGGPSATRSNTYRALEPSAGLQYQIDPEVMAYFTFNRGFKAGGFNGVQFTSFPAFAEYGSEHVNAYEAGIKSKLFGNKLLVNVDAFRSNYEALQVNSPFYVPQFNAYEAVVRNAASSQSQGIELETQLAVTPAFRLGANVTYLDSKYTSFPDSSPPTLQNACANSYVVPACSAFAKPVAAIADVTGQRTPYSPTWSGNVSASYSFDFGSDYRLTIRANPYFTSGYYADGANGNDPFFRVPGYVRLDGQITLELPKRHLFLDLIGKNLTDRKILDYNSLIFAQKEVPINVAAQVRLTF